MKRKLVFNGKRIAFNITFVLAVIIMVNFVSNSVFGKREYQTRTITVRSNDTLWNIASNICEKDTGLTIHTVISDIKNINNMDSSDILIGQQIEVPIY